ncbi:ADP-ribosylation factor-like protein 4A [Teleopsis dalmanni]|uniref:ADP-ribosylation factor-like protein 4A n=1 Tax=Teleopsis dalmanni TaxID=139649 RepID=UPI0018CE990F|nr:ADP-ribosylation factor-like protein 4A [Teleopsis dalmanni]XP_037945123.1 ADP-ribosylation factor-like protein 4A [Teleopsis dalmanni]XP_037945124.1 ADP-ribosylation factor-like protein 4A [Teleopsis dalmanni]XP_037949624.1 ADP-ribosylation factor-like protein 4A [Teleopsis dalmanni]XP_037949625.1 ADP-ribosylation factor-like protein 4A [Teleopsis dalmanni]XP_037949627.1 ADP-ribosylation factor-like protein 4A [Teleopsis dalmanni]
MGVSMGKSGNILDALPTQGTFHVVMLGLDSAGKTTALYRLKFDQYLNTVPTIGFNCEKVQGTYGKAKGVQFLVWDVGGQEKLRPLWRSYTRCTDGILFVVDSVDVERMEEAKMELMRTAKCPDNQGVPVLILANKQDLPGARDPKELEKLLGLQELLYPVINLSTKNTGSSSTGNIVSCSSTSNTGTTSSLYGRSLTPTSQHIKSFSVSSVALSSRSLTNDNLAPSVGVNTLSQTHITLSNISDMDLDFSQLNDKSTDITIPASTIVTSPNTKVVDFTAANKVNTIQFKGWYIQPACAITGEGLQEGLEALYDMIIKRRKLNKSLKKKR